MLHSVGWFDNLLIPSMRDYVRLAADPKWGPYQYLRAEAVDHEYHHLRDVPITQDNDHAPHPGTGDNRWLATRHSPSTQTLHEGALHLTVQNDVNASRA